MPTDKSSANASAPQRGAILLSIARAAISCALGQAVSASACEEAWLQQALASFVTLTQRGQLRGCMGSLQAYRALRQDVTANAVAAALHDSRFAPLTLAELGRTQIEVSVLSVMQAIAFDTQAQALAQLRPGIDGVVFEYFGRRSTFLPQVWQQLPEPIDFMAQLKRKAGLPVDFWAAAVTLQRYSVSQWQEEMPP